MTTNMLARIAMLVVLCVSAGAMGARAAESELRLNPAFDPRTETYTAMVLHEVDEVVFDLAAEHPDATVTVNGNAPDTPVRLAVGENTIVIVVTAQDERYTRTYTVVVTRRGAGAGSVDLSALAVESGADGNWSALDIGAFHPDTTAYAATVPHAATHARLTATAADAAASLRTGAGTDLSAVAGGTAGAAVALEVGANALVVEVTAGDGVKKTYAVTVTRAAPPSSSADLSGLTAEAGADGNWSALDIGAFDSDTTGYAATVPYATTHARLTATAADANATVAGGAEVALEVGGNALAVEVTAEDGTAKTYTVTVTRAAREPSTNADLSALTAEAGTDGNWSALDIGAFDADTTGYSATVPWETTHARLTATAADANAALTGGAEVALEVGANALAVEVTAEDGTIKTYTVTVTREARTPLSTDLRWLLFQGASNGAGPWTKVPFAFAPGTTEYALTVPYATTVGRVQATPVYDEDGSYSATLRSGMGTDMRAARPGFWSRGYALSVGSGNVFPVEVTAEDGAVRTYRVTVTRAARALSSNANLSGLSAQAAGADGRWSALDLGAFSAGTTAYAVTVPYGTTQARLTATAAHAKAALRAGAAGSLSAVSNGSAGAAVALDVGANALAVQVTAEDGTARTYRVTVTREAAPPLTASFGNVPAEHDGGEAFAIDLRFSEALGGGGVAPTAASFRVQAGDVAGVDRVSAGLWRVRVQPKNWKDVTVTLSTPPDCAATGAVCTADGRALSNTVTATVGGPVRIRVEGARAKEGEDETLDFAVTLNRAAAQEVSVDYETADDTATAGADYTATSGTLVFAAGETAKTVSVPVLDDAVDEGRETMRLRLSNPRGAYLRNIHRQARGIIVNDDPLQSMWLSRFGRTVGGHIADAVSDRLSGGLAPGAHATLAGQGVDLTRTDDGRVLADTLTGLAQRFGAQAPAPGANDGGPFARHGMGGGWNAPASTLSSSPGASPANSMTGRELLLGSSFHVAGGGEGSGPGLAAWGRAAHGSFSGEEASDGGRMSLDGEVLTGTLGADADWGRLLAGVAVSFSAGEGTFAQPGVDSGQLESTMTTVSPYARFDLTERVSAWGLAGWGTGAMTIVQDARDATDTQPARERTVTKADLSMRMGAVGARGALLTQDEAGGMDLALKADAMFVTTESEKAAGSAATAADASRLRLVLEGGRSFAVSETATLRPSLELGVRHDGGDAETGAGVEIGGGVSYTDAASGLSIEAKARMLVAHADSDYEEWGASATARLDPGERGRGLSFSLAPTIGAASSASERLWGARDARALAPDGGTFSAARGLVAEAGYGLSLFGDRFTGTPNIGFGMSDGGARDYRIGWRVTSAVEGDPGFEVNLDATRREAANGNEAPEHGVMLRSLIRW